MPSVCLFPPPTRTSLLLFWLLSSLNIAHGSVNCVGIQPLSQDAMSSPKQSFQLESAAAFRPAKVAASPFNKPGADITLLSSDGVHFHVHKAVLTLASQVFEDMFSLGDANHSDASSATSVRPIVEVSEDSQTIDGLLRLCYPVTDPVLDTLKKIEPVLAAAMKYEAIEARQLLCSKLELYTARKPIEVFALACRHGLSRQAGLAAIKWRKALEKMKAPGGKSFSSTIPGVTLDHAELNGVTAGQFQRLIRYLRSGTLPQSLCQPHTISSEDIISGESWSRRPLFNRKDADLIARSSDNVDFRVHRAILSVNGGDELISRAVHVETLDGLQVLQVDTCANILAVLLLLCYPSGVVHTQPRVSHIYSYSEVVRLALRYKMEPIANAVRVDLAKETHGFPLTAWCIATQLGWKKEAAAALHELCLKTPPPLDAAYSLELEKVSATAYGRLLKHHHEHVSRKNAPSKVGSPTRKNDGR